MEFIIGREASVNGSIGRRLCITSTNNKVFFLGHEGSVPATVSRQHCKLSAEADGSFTLINLKPANITYVNGQEIMKKRVSAKDAIELGSERYRLDLQAVLNTVGDLLPKPAVSIAHLEAIWDNYQAEKVAIQVRRSKSAAVQSVTGILSMLSIACGFIPDIPTIVRILLYAMALGLAIYFFIVRYRNAGKEARELKEFEDRFKEQYVCPCGCGRSFGYQEYKQLVITQKMCPLSKRPYTTD